MRYYLFLDDERRPQDVTWVNLPKVDWIVARNFAEFRDYIETHGLPKFISFDHDLGMSKDGKMERSGMDCAKWLVDVCMDLQAELPDFVVHSMNPVGRRNIEAYLENFKRNQNRGFYGH